MLSKLVKSSKLYLTAAALTVLTACSSSGLEEVDFDNLSKEQREAKLLSLNELEENGKVGFMAVLSGQRFSVDFNYHYKHEDFSLEFTGPMGMQYAKVDVMSDGETLLKVRSEEFFGNNPRELLKREFGFDVPVADLRKIMLGMPEGEKIYDGKGYVTSCNFDDEYIVRYKQYKTFRGGYTLPTDIEISTAFSKIRIKVNNVVRIN